MRCPQGACLDIGRANCGCFHRNLALFVSVLVKSNLVFGSIFGRPDSWKLPYQ